MSQHCPKQFIHTGILIVFVVSLIPYPVYQVQAKSDLNRTIDNAAALMYISDAILSDESEIEDSPDAIRMLSLTQKKKEDVDTNPLLARFIHAKIKKPLTS